jgi:hypothetical protein
MWQLASRLPVLKCTGSRHGVRGMPKLLAQFRKTTLGLMPVLTFLSMRYREGLPGMLAALSPLGISPIRSALLDWLVDDGIDGDTFYGKSSLCPS